jgi:hypothetical protein
LAGGKIIWLTQIIFNNEIIKSVVTKRKEKLNPEVQSMNISYQEEVWSKKRKQNPVLRKVASISVILIELLPYWNMWLIILSAEFFSTHVFSMAED